MLKSPVPNKNQDLAHKAGSHLPPVLNTQPLFINPLPDKLVQELQGKEPTAKLQKKIARLHFEENQHNWMNNASLVEKSIVHWCAFGAGISCKWANFASEFFKQSCVEVSSPDFAWIETCFGTIKQNLRNPTSQPYEKCAFGTITVIPNQTQSGFKAVPKEWSQNVKKHYPSGESGGKITMGSMWERVRARARARGVSAEPFWHPANRDALESAWMLGVCHFQGEGVPRDWAKAVTLFKQSSAKGGADAL
ncbi:hypothetical protein Pelo_16378 [Pelomyxa schiedti]|nr:hypothetical protein Pelo_16378 [Pelomyxa schiedti]